jgi:hypothetical protein
VYKRQLEFSKPPPAGDLDVEGKSDLAVILLKYVERTAGLFASPQSPETPYDYDIVTGSDSTPKGVIHAPTLNGKAQYEPSTAFEDDASFSVGSDSVQPSWVNGYEDSGKWVEGQPTPN